MYVSTDTYKKMQTDIFNHHLHRSIKMSNTSSDFLLLPGFRPQSTVLTSVSKDKLTIFTVMKSWPLTHRTFWTVVFHCRWFWLAGVNCVLKYKTAKPRMLRGRERGTVGDTHIVFTGLLLQCIAAIVLFLLVAVKNLLLSLIYNCKFITVV